LSNYVKIYTKLDFCGVLL